ncbi:MAG: ABC transporter ATP-binding protein [Lachnospiraceae bacterium]|nr:ABC transporter ATP-binding protein [Lachnospiraceae bacterium]MDY3818190.1 ABC transporter ATP-binding protein [Lachnospiraceae bacterium]
MIRVENVCKDFDGFRALSHLNMHVPKGSIYGLVGPNGAGKSTIIRHIVGDFRQDTGSVLVDGAPIYENIEKKAKIAFIPDDIFYFMQANTNDMKKFYQSIYPSFDAELFEKLKVCFPAVNVKRNIRNLSKGMQKQVAFWLAICCRPELLILDEPVDGLDPVMRRQIWSLMMNDVAERGTTVLVSSHNLRELEDVCDHVGIMDHGSLLLERSLCELQGGVSKIQIAFEGEMPALPEDLQVLHQSRSGRVHTLIVRAAQGVASQALAKLQPILLDEIPLTLEEIFIYELGGADYAVKDILF